MKALILVGSLALAFNAYAGDDVNVNVDTGADENKLLVDASTRGGFGAEIGVDSHAAHGTLLGVYGRFGAPLGDGVYAGVRTGLVSTDELALHAIPIDLFVGTNVNILYLELLGGPWFMTRARDFNMHLAGGAGINVAGLKVGVEAGWLNPAPMIGGRLGVAF